MMKRPFEARPGHQAYRQGGPDFFFYGGMAAFARVEAPVIRERMSQRLLSVLSVPVGRMPCGGSATFPQLPVSGYLGPDLDSKLGRVS